MEHHWLTHHSMVWIAISWKQWWMDHKQGSKNEMEMAGEVQETLNKEKKVKHKMDQEDCKKKLAVHDSNEEKLCRSLKKHCTPMLMGMSETQHNHNQHSLSDPMKSLEAIKNSCLN